MQAQPRPPDLSKLPIFPLGTVLFPGGALPLKVFEARYIDMTRECMKSGMPFGVCLIKDGAEVGTPAVPHEIGCLATITDWDMQQLGVLQIKTRGSQRFRILSSRVESNGLIRAATEPIADDAGVGVRSEFAGCMILLKALLPKLPAELIPEPHDFDSAAWLSNRLSEVLPIPALAKQKLMELQDPDSRLEIIHKFLGQQGLK
jgi:Lon protease-like protein